MTKNATLVKSIFSFLLKVPKTLYHGTTYKHLGSILTKGILPSFGEVCFTEDKHLAIAFGYIACHRYRMQENDPEHYPLLIAVNTAKMPLSAFKVVGEGFGTYWSYRGVVGAKNLSTGKFRVFPYDEKGVSGAFSYLLANKKGRNQP